MTRITLCAVADLPEGMSRSFETEDYDVVVARSGETVFALEDRCSHDDGEFDGGPVMFDGDQAEIECPRHGARFDLASGLGTAFLCHVQEGFRRKLGERASRCHFAYSKYRRADRRRWHPR